MTTSRLERLLPWACFAAAAVLVASELMTMFEFVPPGAEPLAEQSSADRHGNAMFVIAAFAIVATYVAVWNGSQPAAIGVVTMGVIALLFFLIGDLPKAGQVGTLDDARQSFIDAETVPQAGFWFLLLGSVGLTFSGAALATMSSEQLKSLAGPRERKPKRAKGEKGKSPSMAQRARKTITGAKAKRGSG